MKKNITKDLEQFPRWQEAQAIIANRADPRRYASVQDWIRRCFNEPSDIELRLCALNEIIGGYGVEVLRGRANQSDSCYYGNIQVEHINMGESYTATIMYDCEAREFLVCSTGDFEEKYPERFPERGE